MKARRSDLVALGFLITAAVFFALFQVLPNSTYDRSTFSGEEEWFTVRGYYYWEGIWTAIQDPDRLDMEGAVFYSSLVVGAVLAVLSPFVVIPLSRSRALWWTAILSSGVMMCGTTGVLVWRLLFGQGLGYEIQLGPGRYCLMLYPVILLIGLLFIRKCPGERRSDGSPLGAE